MTPNISVMLGLQLLLISLSWSGIIEFQAAPCYYLLSLFYRCCPKGWTSQVHEVDTRWHRCRPLLEKWWLLFMECVWFPVIVFSWGRLVSGLMDWIHWNLHILLIRSHKLSYWKYKHIKFNWQHLIFDISSMSKDFPNWFYYVFIIYFRIVFFNSS